MMIPYLLEILVIQLYVLAPATCNMSAPNTASHMVGANPEHLDNIL